MARLICVTALLVLLVVPHPTTHGTPIDNALIPQTITENPPPITETVCSAGAADYFFVLDGSSSIGPANFQLLREWLAGVARRLPGDSRFAVIEYSGAPVTLWTLDNRFKSPAEYGGR